MKLITLGSSSHGNCYILDNGSEALIIEAGINMKEVRRALGYNISKVSGCIVTHRHNDHAKHIHSMVKCGITTLALPDVWESKGIFDINARNIELGKGYQLGGFKVLTAPAEHDVPCAAFMIEHKDMSKLLFLTDSCSFDYRFCNLSHIMIECNYSDKMLEKAISEGRTQPNQRKRLLESHMNLDTCKFILHSTNLTNVQEIILLHLSDNNSDEQDFVMQVKQATGKPTYAANVGFTIDL